MKPLLLLSALFLTVPSIAEDNFERDRTAILAMAGEFKVSFDFEETATLDPDYKIKKPYHADARELVEVAEDTGKRITLQHLLIIDEGELTEVIKHWAQIWQYEDTLVLNYQGDTTWEPEQLDPEQVKGTWTQYVTQVDDSPRYKAAGSWKHTSNWWAWTSQPSTRPLPRREYTKRSDYDLLEVVNRHLITADGWLHEQDNRKVITREGRHHYLCAERGLNHYQRITAESDLVDFKYAEDYWAATAAFWADVRASWEKVLTSADGPISYETRVENQRLRSRIGELAEDFAAGTKPEPGRVDTILSDHLR